MIEQKCLLLNLTPGKPKIDDPETPPVRATAVCYARTYDECPKARNKLEITTMCFRMRAHRIADQIQEVKKEEVDNAAVPG